MEPSWLSPAGHSQRLTAVQFAVLLELAAGIAEGLQVLVTGCALPRLLDAYDEHQALLKEQETLKRRAENGYGLSQGWGGSGGSLLWQWRCLSALSQLMSG